MSEKPTWPVFHMVMQCPGFQSWEKTERGNYECVDRVCHESRYRDFTVVHGELVIELSICDHVRDSADCSCSEEVGEFLEKYYDDIAYDRERGAVFAFARGFRHQYVWAYSVHGSCDNCKWFAQSYSDGELLRYPSEFVEGPGRHFITTYASMCTGQFWWQGNQDKRSFETKKFCSVKCAAEYRRARCPTCGKYDKNTFVDRFRAYSKKICSRAGVSPSSIDWNFCSRQCCSLALDGYLRKEREERKRKKNLKCVLEVRKVLSKAKSALQKRDSQEVLQSLKKAFEQAASSP